MMKLIRTIYGSYVNAKKVDYFYTGEADFKDEKGYSVEAVSGDKNDMLYFCGDKDEADAYLLWLVRQLGRSVEQWDFEDVLKRMGKDGDGE